MKEVHPSIKEITQQYLMSIGHPHKDIAHWHFCDNEHDANECAELVLAGVKRATSPSLWWHELNDEPLPSLGDLNIVTNWQGEAQCVIETVSVKLVPYKDISEKYAELEGEGDKSLDYWKRVHWDYYHRELEGSKYKPTVDMMIVCEEFKVVYKA